MNDTIKLSDCSYLERIKENTYILKCKYDHIRAGYSDNALEWIDPPSGPMIFTGRNIESHTVKSIDKVEGKGFIITFEDDLFSN